MFLLVVRGVLLNERGPFLRQVLFRENSGNRAFINAEAAVYARFGINIKHFRLVEVGFISGWMDTVNRANGYAGRVLGSDAGFRDNMSHVRSLQGSWIRASLLGPMTV